jgi:hypothetical protein
VAFFWKAARFHFVSGIETARAVVPADATSDSRCAGLQDSIYYQTMNMMSPLVRPVHFILLALALGAWSGCHSPMGSARSEKDIARLQVKAEKGSPELQFDLAQIYATGDGVPLNDEEAFKWFQRAAEQGHADAQYHLGLMFKDGRGVAKDYVQAYKWLNLSAARGNANASMRVDSLRRSMSREQITEAQREAAAFVPRKRAPASEKSPPETMPPPQTRPSAP